jgi:hypothetical protein
VGLGAYAMPVSFTILDAMPRTISGKIDKKSLVATPEKGRGDEEEKGKSHVVEDDIRIGDDEEMDYDQYEDLGDNEGYSSSDADRQRIVMLHREELTVILHSFAEVLNRKQNEIQSRSNFFLEGGDSSRAGLLKTCISILPLMS